MQKSILADVIKGLQSQFRYCWIVYKAAVVLSLIFFEMASLMEHGSRIHKVTFKSLLEVWRMACGGH